MKQAQSHPWLAETDTSSYRCNFASFLDRSEIKIKPKRPEDLDQIVLQQLYQIGLSFTFDA